MKKIPLYSKIIDELKERIRTGDFEYDVPFVTEEKITKEYNVSRITAIRALDELEKIGVIYRKRGSGSFVTENGIEILDGVQNDTNEKETVFIKRNKELLLIALVLPFDVKRGGMMECFNGINDLLNSENCFVRVYNTNGKNETEATVLRELLDNDIDGVICYPKNDNKNLEIFNQFLTKNIPLVVIDKYIENMPISYVVPDNYNGARELCNYAIEAGHDRIGFFSVTDFSGVCSLRERYMGYAMSMNDHGKEVNLDDVLIGDRRKDFYCEGMKNDGEYLRHAVKKLYKSGTTAIICQNDWVARDIIHCCDELGISVPDDMLIMGFDHVNAFTPIDVGERITTVEQNFYEIGKKAGEVILKELQERKGQCLRVVVPMKLIEGVSDSVLKENVYV